MRLPPEGLKPRTLYDLRAPMRDTVELSTDVYIPATGDGPWPTVLIRTPYDNTWIDAGVKRALYLARQGYAVAIQDVRGRCDSDGQWEPFFNEGRDGYDSVEWLAEQPWSDGNVGMMGVSYLGFVQWVAAKEQPPHLKCLVSTAAAGRWMEELPYSFGRYWPYWIMWLNLVGGRGSQANFMELPEAVDWRRIYTHKPLRDLDLALGRTNTPWRTWLEHPTFDDYWRRISLVGHFHNVNLPVLHITGWFDGDQWGQMFYWHGMAESSPAADRQWLISGPWNHGQTWNPGREHGGRDFGVAALMDLDAEHLRFFDRWLKGIDNGQEDDARSRIFVMGADAWREDADWPPPGMVETDFFFHSGGKANTLGGDGRLSREAPGGDEPADTYTYNPDDPTPSVPDLAMLRTYEADLDNRWRLRRDDVLVYTSEPLVEDVEISGHPVVVLHASSDCTDTDWFVSLADVYPDGRSDELTKGGMKATYRGPDAPHEPLAPGQVYEFKMELMAISNLFKRGHRIRVAVQSADYPFSARNPNTNAPIGYDDEVLVAHNTVWHTAARPSRLIAPVVSSGSGPRPSTPSPNAGRGGDEVGG
jgi:putative CocE/NonD family hydrolase